MDEKIEIIKDIEKYIAFWFVTQEAITDYKAEVEEEIKKRKRAYATALYNAGYRKESDTAREIFEKIFEVLCCFTTQGKSKEYAEGFIDCLEEVDKRLQNLAKEKYGVDLGE